jgi:hypothetical protein
MIALEMIRFQKQENPTSGRVTDARRLGRTVRPRRSNPAPPGGRDRQCLP